MMCKGTSFLLCVYVYLNQHTLHDYALYITVMVYKEIENNKNCEKQNILSLLKRRENIED